MAKKNHAGKAGRENDIFDKVLLWFGASLVYELFLMAVNRYYFHYRVSEIAFAAVLDEVLHALIYVGLAGLAAGVVWAFTGRRNRSKLLPSGVAVFSAAVSVCCYLSRQYGSVTIQLLQVLVPVAAVLALVYYLYQKEFFAIAVLSCLCILGLWLCRRAEVGHKALCSGYMGVFLAVVAAVVLFAIILQRRKGVWKAGEKQYRILQRNAAYFMLYITCGIAGGAVIAALVLGPNIAYYEIFLMVAWIFISAVYYTVRLM